MSSRFTDMANRVAAERAAKEAAEKQKSNDERAKKDFRQKTDTDALNKFVRPILEEARQNFAAAGHAFAISEDFPDQDRLVYAPPKLSFHGQSLGRRRNTRAVFFIPDNGILTVRTEKVDGELLDSAPMAQAEDVVVAAVEWALRAFHDDNNDDAWAFTVVSRS
jgi:hypothetical protein